jgi:hypothetical protein
MQGSSCAHIHDAIQGRVLVLLLGESGGVTRGRRSVTVTKSEPRRAQVTPKSPDPQPSSMMRLSRTSCGGIAEARETFDVRVSR